MHVLTFVVGSRTEHWTDLFDVLCNHPDLRFSVIAADVSEATRQDFDRLARIHTNFNARVVPHWLGEGRSGHMASVMFRRLALDDLPAEPPDVVHVIGEAAYLSTWQVLRLCRRHWPSVPTTLYAAQNVVTRFPLPFPILEQAAYRSVRMTLPITPQAREVLQAKGYRGQSSIVPLGVDTRTFRPSAQTGRDGRFTVGFVGRLEPHKGVLDLLRAAELVDCDVLLVGDGSLAAEIDLAGKRRPGRVRRHNWVTHDQLPALLGAMSTLALPSVEVIQRNVLPWVGIPLREQFGRVLVEAMACGVPVIGSDVGEIPYVVGDAGLIFPAGDVTALADQLTRLRDEPGLTTDLAARGLHRVETEFTWERVADRLHDIWHGLAAAATAAPTSRPRFGDPAELKGEVRV
ncbi:glycosyltransferase family 4 protein [Micromonospora sp. S-DT3-3-22]|uniref:glycosyltransferase family 4 protein n=1 Tax=Micromonospora sp. S-DT3-3-22 TaxID=2755359 RepID=UPI00189099A9|nr:glycosyltransferase family 4 protein [Micromonospora sp. S-DT3-3-22]